MNQVGWVRKLPISENSAQRLMILPSFRPVGVTPSMRRPVSVKSVFLLPPCEFLVFEPSRLCRHPSIRTLLLSDYRSVQVGRSRFSRCCYLIIDLGSRLFARELGQELVAVT